MVLSDALSKSSHPKSNKASYLLLKNVTISYKSGLRCIKLKYPDLKLPYYTEITSQVFNGLKMYAIRN